MPDPQPFSPMTNDKMTAPAPGAVELYDYSQFAGTGFENTSEKDLATPFIEVLQTNSKKCSEGSPKYVPGARPGMFLNTGSRELIPGKTGFGLVPLHIERCIVEWSPERTFVARHPIDSPLYAEALARFEKSTDPNKSMSKDVKTADGKNHLVKTYYLWALLLDESGEQATSGVILPFKSTNFSTYQNQIYTPLYSFKLPGGSKLFAHRLRCTLRLEQRAKGDSYNYCFEPLRGTIKDSLIDPRSELMQSAYRSYRNVVEGRAKMADESSVAAGGDAESAPDEVFS